MHKQMHFQIVLLCMCFMFIAVSLALPCDSCGHECTNACGTKHFRTCCFNYLRKRTDPEALNLSSNKRLIDFILLQGRTLFTQNELRSAEERLKNGSFINVGYQTYDG